MSKHEEVMLIMQFLKVADKHHVGKVMSAQGYWTAGTSASNNAYKVLCDLADLNQIEKCRGFFRIPDCKSEYDEHARQLTHLLAEILSLPFQSTIFREHYIASVGLRPDALILLSDHQRGLCLLILEVANRETESSLLAKEHVWQQWPQAKEYLSQLFKVPIAHYDFVRSDEFDRYVEEVVYDHTHRYLRDLSHDAGARRLREASAAGANR